MKRTALEGSCCFTCLSLFISSHCEEEEESGGSAEEEDDDGC